MFIGDGMGFEHVKAARLYQGTPLSFESFAHNAQVRTYSANNAVTDSAAAASAMATGCKVNNGVLSVAVPGNGGELETTLEFFKKQGKATGLITTTYLTHATPAGFGAHDVDRNNTSAIGTDLLTQTKPNVLFGGGGNGLDATTATAAGYQVATDSTGFNSLDPAQTKLCALFGTGDMPYEEDYLSGGYPYPHLREMVAKALDTLEKNPNGFFLMVEAGRIDHAAGSTTLPEMIHETLELSRAVQSAIDWLGNRTDTLVIVTADHETGGLAVTQDNGQGIYPTVTWASSYTHTSANVPAYAYGMDAERIVGTLDNTYIRPICTGEALSVPANAVTLVPTGATWKYEASGTDLGTAWREPGYADTTWASGPAQLGYGDGDEATRLPSSPIRSCYYFRHKFNVSNPEVWSSLSLEILRDDGAVVYLNGQEVARYNIDDNPVLFGSWAEVATDYSWDPAKTIPNLLVAGDNVLAVEIHQCSSTSTDISLDAKLTGNAELNVIPNEPIAGATGVPAPATLTATATDPAGNPLTVAFFGRQAPPPAPDFSIVVLPDSQNYTAGLNGGSPEIFVKQAQWIVDSRASQNIVYAAHLGDICNNGDIQQFQWVNAQNALSLLDQIDFPYGVAVGNHDQLVAAGDNEPTTFYNQYFGVSHFSGRSYYGGHYGANNNNHYDLFSASGLDFIVIYLEYATNSVPSAVLDWADGLLKANPDRRGILVSHLLIETSGAWSSQGQSIYNALRDNPNLFLMLAGHHSVEVRRTDVYGGNTVHTIMADYQADTSGGNGFLRILRFSPSNNQVFVQTYSPWINQFQTDSASEFALSYPMQTGPAFQLVQQNTTVASGTLTSATWSGLLPGAEYEWFATATDGPERAISETRRFTILDNVPPTTAITEPLTGTTFLTAPATFKIAASASDLDGSVTSVRFFANGVSLGDAAGAPYEFSATLGAGTYDLTAVVTDDKGATTTSDPVHVIVGAKPTAPSDLVATVDSRTQITLTWNDTSDNESGFEVYQSTGASAFVLVGTKEPNVNTAILQGLQPSITYSFIVRAFNVSGFDDSTVSATTLANNPPIAVADVHTVSEDSALTIVAAEGVLANDTDGDGDLLTGALVSGPSHGTLNLGTDGAFTYTPNANFSGPDSFIYEARDGYSAAPATVTLTVTPVNDPPAVPPSVTANASPDLVTLSWAASTDPDGDPVTYQIYRSERSPVPTETQQPLATVDTLVYSDSAIVNGRTYYYVVVAVDLSGAPSMPTAEVSAKPEVLPINVFVSGNPVLSSGTLAGDYASTFETDAVTQNITETGTATGARLQADYTLVTTVDPADITSLALYLTASWSSGDGLADPLLVQIRNTSGSWESISEDIQDGEFSPTVPQNYVSQDGMIVVRFTDGATIRREKKDTLRIDQLFARIVAGPPDTTPPSAPTGLTANAGDTQIQLDWADNAERDVVGYNVYRSTSSNSGYDQVNSALVTASSCLDSGLNNGTEYYYVVTAVDGSGNESDPAKPVQAIPVAQAPAAPSSLTAISRDSQVELIWADNTEADVVGYKVYRSTAGGDYALITLQPVTASQYLDTDVVNGTQYSYYVTALDQTLESAGSLSVSASPIAQANMHVEGITVTLTQSGKSYKGSGTAFLVNSGHGPLPGATLTAEWWVTRSGSASSLLQTQAVTSGGDGSALFVTAPAKVTSGTTFTLRITGVTLPGYVFVPADGVIEAISPPVP